MVENKAQRPVLSAASGRFLGAVLRCKSEYIFEYGKVQSIIRGRCFDASPDSTVSFEEVFQCCAESSWLPRCSPWRSAAPLRPKPALSASATRDRKSTRLNSSHGYISYAV